MELEEHYDNTDDMYCDIADRLEAVEAAAPAASLSSSAGGHMNVKGKDCKAKGSGGGAKVGGVATFACGRSAKHLQQVRQRMGRTLVLERQKQ